MTSHNVGYDDPNLKKKTKKKNKKKNNKLFIRRSEPELFMSVSRLTEDQMVIFFCSSIPLLLFDNPGIY